MRTQRCIAYVFAACLVLLLAGTAMAAPSDAKLNGTYRYTLTSSCILAQDPGFTASPNLQPIGYNEVNQINVTGVTLYDGEGGATSTGKGFLISSSPGLPNYVLTFDETCTFTYHVNSDGTFSQNGSCTGTNTNGPSYIVPSTYALGNLAFEGLVSSKGEQVNYSEVKLTQSTLATSRGFSAKRLCGVEGTNMRIGKKGDFQIF